MQYLLKKIMDSNIYYYQAPMGILHLQEENDKLNFCHWVTKNGYTQSGAEMSITSDKVSSFMKEVKDELDGYFANKLKKFSIDLHIQGTEFQQKTWDALQEIPYGTTLSYQDLAAKVGSPKASRAVGSANGQNAFCIFIPCHRVIQKNGGLGGYNGGIKIKKSLLALEQS